MKRRFTSFTVRLPEGLAVAVQNAAREQGVSRSDILRSALTVFLGVSADLTDPRQQPLSLAETLADFPDLADVDPLNLPDLPEFDGEQSSMSAPTSPGQPVSHPEPTPAVDLTPQTDDERALFRLAAINTAPGRTPPKARFQNAQQANDFRSAVAVLNGETVRVLEAFYRGGGGGIGKAVSYVCGAARKRQATPPLEAEQPPMFFAPTSWEE